MLARSRRVSLSMPSLVKALDSEALNLDTSVCSAAFVLEMSVALLALFMATCVPNCAFCESRLLLSLELARFTCVPSCEFCESRRLLSLAFAKFTCVPSCAFKALRSLRSFALNWPAVAKVLASCVAIGIAASYSAACAASTPMLEFAKPRAFADCSPRVSAICISSLSLSTMPAICPCTVACWPGRHTEVLACLSASASRVRLWLTTSASRVAPWLTTVASVDVAVVGPAVAASGTGVDDGGGGVPAGGAECCATSSGVTGEMMPAVACGVRAAALAWRAASAAGTGATACACMSPPPGAGAAWGFGWLANFMPRLPLIQSASSCVRPYFCMAWSRVTPLALISPCTALSRGEVAIVVSFSCASGNAVHHVSGDAGASNTENR